MTGPLRTEAGPARPATAISLTIADNNRGGRDRPNRSDEPAGVGQVLDALHAAGANPRKSGQGWSANCPAHDDAKASLSVGVGSGGKVLLKCHAGCHLDAILGAMGLDRSVLRGEDRNNGSIRTARGSPDAVYDYRDKDGHLLFQVLRYPNKRFVQRCPDPDAESGWSWNLRGVEARPLYRLPAVLAAVDQGRPVYVCEGERDVDAVVRARAVGTCNSGGAGKWRPEHAQSLAGAGRVIVVADRDEPGYAHARQVAASLRPLVDEVVMVEPLEGKDVTDHLAAGYCIEELARIEADKPEPTPEAAKSPAGEAVPAGLNANGAGQKRPPESGSRLLDDIHHFVTRFVSFLKAEYAVAVALWVVHTYALGEDCFESTPRLAILSPEKQSGKTRLLEVLGVLVRQAREWLNVTPAALFRLIAKEQPTVLLDEVDAIFGPGAKEHEDLRALLNAGHRRGALVPRCSGDGAKMEVREYPVFAPVAMAGIGDLPDTLADRSIVLRMQRRAPHEHVEPFRLRDVRTEADALRDRAEAWAAQNRESLARRPSLPEGVRDRAADVWEPLLAVAEVAGGEWPRRAREAALAVVAAQGADPPATLNRQLLADCRTVFEATGEARLSSTELVGHLRGLEEAPWDDLRDKGLNKAGLATRLAKYAIRPKTIRFGDKALRGYDRADFEDAWSRYLPRLDQDPDPAQGATGSTSTELQHFSGPSTRDVAPVAGVAPWGGRGVNAALPPRNLGDYPAVDALCEAPPPSDWEVDSWADVAEDREYLPAERGVPVPDARKIMCATRTPKDGLTAVRGTLEANETAGSEVEEWTL